MSNNTMYIDPGYEKFLVEANELNENYKSACDWISSLGIDYKRTRFGTYEKDFLEFVKAGGQGSAKESVKTYFNAHLEAHELIRIKTTFEELDCSGFLDTVKKVTSGQRFRNASSSDQSRDFAFELNMASRFIKAGYDVDLRTITDLVAHIDDRKLFVECKRIKSQKQLEKRVKEANTQIKTRLSSEASSQSRGMIALNLTDVLNPDAMPIIVESVGEYKQASSETLREYLLEEKETLSKKRHPKCLAVFTEFNSLGFLNADVPNECAFVSVREGNIYKYPLKFQDNEFLDTFWKKLGNQNLISST